MSILKANTVRKEAGPFARSIAAPTMRPDPLRKLRKDE